jgi:PAS domain S-box-containing protein
MAEGHQQRESGRDGAEPSDGALLGAIPGAAFVLGPGGTIRARNERGSALLDGTATTLDGLVRPDDRERVRDAVSTALEAGSATVDVTLDAEGTPIRFDCSRIEENDHPSGVLAVGRAETAAADGAATPEGATTPEERRGGGTGDGDDAGDAVGTEADDAVGTDVDLFRRADVVEAVGDGAYVLDRDRRVAAVTDRLIAMTGRDRGELVGEPLGALLADDSQAAAIGLHEALLAGDRSTGTAELSIGTTDGPLPAELNATAVEDDDGRVVVGVLRDVSDRRRREHQLARHRDQLATLNRISEAVEGVVQGIVESATRDGIEETVCERLAASDLYRTVWVGRIGPSGLEPTTTAGAPALFEVGGAGGGGDGGADHPARVAFESGEPCVRRAELVGGEAAPVDRTLPAEHGIRASMALPITHNETPYGVLCLRSPRPDAFTDREQAALERLARVVGFAINAADTEQLLHSAATTELEFRVRGANCFLATLSAEGGPVALRWTVPEDDGLRHFVEVEAPAETAVAAAEAAGATGIEVVSEREAEDEPTATILEALPAASVADRLGDAGAVIQQATAEDGVAEVTARIAGQADTRTVVETFQEEYEAGLKAKRRVEEPVETARDLREAATERLTERQSDVLRTAYLMGYFEWPRVHNAEEVAERMDITSATLHYHLRAAERSFLELFFDESPAGG